MSARPCANCAAEFTPRAVNGRYCSTACRRKTHYRQQVEYQRRLREGQAEDAARIQQSKDALAACQKRMSRDAQKLARRHRRRVPA